MGKIVIALFGGTFDPIHLGHIHLAQELLKKYSFEKLIFIPAYQNPLKEKGPQASNALRVEMLQAALAELNEPRFEVSTIELERTGKSYTIDTVEAFKTKWPEKEFALIVGNEVFRDFPKWNRPLDILNYVNLIIISREDQPFSLEETLKKIEATPRQLSENKWSLNFGKTFIEYFRLKTLPFSSTEVRENIRRLWEIRDNERTDTMMPQGIQRSVWLLIKVNQLYTVRKEQA